MTLDDLLTPRNVAAVVLAASVGVLGTAYFFQYVIGVQPCILCLYQRVPYAVTIALGVIAVALALAGKPRAIPWLLGLCAVAFAIGSGIAAFHVGVEQHWWEGTSECSGGAAAATTVEELRAQLSAKPVVRCDEVPWALFGISMAGYNVFASLALAAFSIFAALRLGRTEAAR
jgi:disulfide bond formation protein DsbB